jgi:hypothetical protein
MKLLDYLLLDADYRGNHFFEQKISVGENANIEGCVFFKCEFDSEEAYTKACVESICVDCHLNGYLPNVKYVQAEIFAKVEIGFADTLGILSSQGTYLIFADDVQTLIDYGVLDGDEDAESEINSVLNSKKEMGVDTQTFKIVDTSIAVLPSEEYGRLDSEEFNAHGRLYNRDDGQDIYYPFLYYPPTSVKNNYDLYVFGDDISLWEQSIYLEDVLNAIQELYPEKHQNIVSAFEAEDPDEYSTISDVTDELTFTCLTEDEVTSLRIHILCGDKHCRVQSLRLCELFETVLNTNYTEEEISVAEIPLGWNYKIPIANGLLINNYNKILILKNLDPKNVTKLKL